MTMPLVDLATLIQVFEDIRESPIEGAFEVTFACKVEALVEKYRFYSDFETRESFVNKL